VVFFKKNGDRVGTKWSGKKKGIAVFLRNPLILMVGQDRIELSTHGFEILLGSSEISPILGSRAGSRKSFDCPILRRENFRISNPET
jgi:hypothetical protein